MEGITKSMLDSAARLQLAFWTADTGAPPAGGDPSEWIMTEAARLVLIITMNRFMRFRSEVRPPGGDKHMEDGLRHLNSLGWDLQFVFFAERVGYHSKGSTTVIDAWTHEVLGHLPR